MKLEMQYPLPLRNQGKPLHRVARFRRGVERGRDVGHAVMGGQVGAHRRDGDPAVALQGHVAVDGLDAVVEPPALLPEANVKGARPII